MKKIISLVLCTIVMFSLISCSSSEPESIPEYEMSEEYADYCGLEVIAGISTTPNYNYQSADIGFDDENVLGYIVNTSLGDIAAQRVKDVEKKYNIDIVFEYVDRPGEKAFYDMIAGINEFDYIMDTSYWLVQYMYAGAFTDLTTLEGIDYSDQNKWGKPNQLEPMMYNGGLYGVYPASFPIIGQCSPSLAIIIDEGYVQQLNATDPRDYYEQGEWTWDTFEKCLRLFTTYDLVPGQKIYALGGMNEWVGLGGMLSNGSQFAYLDSNNQLVLGVYSDETYEALSVIKNWQFGEYSDCILNIGYGDYFYHFPLRDCVMYLGGTENVLSSTKSAAYVYEDFGLVQFPTGPNATSKDVPNWFNGLNYTLSIPLITRDAEMSATVINALYSPFEGFETRQDIIDYLCKNYFKDERDAEVFMKYSDMMYYQYHNEIGNPNYAKIYRNNATVSQVFGSKSVDYEYYNKYALDKKLTMKELYPDN